jgi:hypothetical protein
VDLHRLRSAKQSSVEWLVALFHITVLAGAVGLAFHADGSWQAIGGIYAAISFPYLERLLLRRVAKRRARRFETHGRELGLEPSVADDREYEGIVDADGRPCHVRVWVEDPPAVQANLFRTVLLAGVRAPWLVVGTAFGGTGLIVALAVAAAHSAWTNRTAFGIESMTEPGIRHTTRVHRISDVRAAMGFIPINPSGPGRAAFADRLEGPELLKRLNWRASEEVLLEVLAALGERGSPDALAPLLRVERSDVLRSPRVIALAERAAQRIRERHGLSDSGGLAVSNVEELSGSLGVSPDTGTLSLPKER